MSMQHTSFGEVKLVSYIQVKRKATGKIEYYKVVDGQSVEISEEEYKLNNK